MKYIVFEGADDTGKTCHRKKITTWLKTQGKRVFSYAEPWLFEGFKGVRQKTFEPDLNDETFFLMCLASRQYARRFFESRNYDVIVSDRSYISMKIYQQEYLKNPDIKAFEEFFRKKEREADYIIYCRPPSALGRHYEPYVGFSEKFEFDDIAKKYDAFMAENFLHTDKILILNTAFPLSDNHSKIKKFLISREVV